MEAILARADDQVHACGLRSGLRQILVHIHDHAFAAQGLGIVGQGGTLGFLKAVGHGSDYLVLFAVAVVHAVGGGHKGIGQAYFKALFGVHGGLHGGGSIVIARFHADQLVFVAVALDTHGGVAQPGQGVIGRKLGQGIAALLQVHIAFQHIAAAVLHAGVHIGANIGIAVVLQGQRVAHYAVQPGAHGGKLSLAEHAIAHRAHGSGHGGHGQHEAQKQAEQFFHWDLSFFK